jgi:hypothetical protein
MTKAAFDKIAEGLTEALETAGAAKPARAPSEAARKLAAELYITATVMPRWETIEAIAECLESFAAHRLSTALLLEDARERARSILEPFAGQHLDDGDISQDSAWNVLLEEFADALAAERHRLSTALLNPSEEVVGALKHQVGHDSACKSLDTYAEDELGRRPDCDCALDFRIKDGFRAAAMKITGQ